MKSYLPFFCSIIFCFIILSPLHADINALLDLEYYEQSYSPNLNTGLQPSLLSQPIVIDGILDSCWFQTACFKNFTEYEPAEYKRARVITAGYLAYDSDNLYISFICQDPNLNQIRASLSDRDKIFDDDWVCVSIDPDNDQQKAYEFYVNARGIQGDKARLWLSN